MALPKSDREPAARPERPRDGDLIPNETSESFRFVRRALRQGRVVSTQGLSDAEVRAVLLGQRKDA